MNHPLVIANGLLGNRVRQRLHPRLLHVLGTPVDWEFTTAPGEATIRTREALQSGVNWLLAAGGDGTINEVVNGFFDARRNIRPECALSFLPLGSGNDWLRTIGVSLNVMQAIDSLPETRSHMVDVGLARFVNARAEWEERVFVNFAEAGVGARLVTALNERRARRSRAAYLVSAVATAFRFKPRRIDLRLDGVSSSAPLLSFIVANGRFFGAGMQCAPMARPDDGKLDLVTIGDFGRLELMLKIRKLIGGQHLSEAKVAHRPVSSLEASSPESVWVQLDGDKVGTLPATFAVLPRALRLRY